MKKKIVILRAVGPIKNNVLENLLLSKKFNTLTFPILNIKKIYIEKIEIENIQAVLITSFFGLYFFSQLTSNRKIKIFLLGDSSKKLAKELGFKNIIDCQGDSVKMFNVITKSINKDKGDLIYAGAKKISVDLPNLLSSIGYKVNRLILYDSKPVKYLNETLLKLIEQEKISWIILLSKKGANNFLELSRKYVDLNKLSFINFCCMSRHIADELKLNNIKKFFPDIPASKKLCELIIKNEAKNGQKN